ncbi:bifunctional folylpolyglutamate synthase/dihydrofolate synthase [Candidatus Bathyarchaeota archaeon]|nr:MAG: bifunctional folylpolyglutamate synthase/dihydrofolate synthase [Candidatus Bathyarchaeota archaeon]
MAFKYFEERGVDYAVVEVGMGGRLDATNVIDAEVAVITNVSLEHTKYLGDTVIEIAGEKAGIIKPGSTLITAVEQPEILELLEGICHDRDAEIYVVDRDIRYRRLRHSLEGQWFNLQGLRGSYRELFIPLLGGHQLRNASCAVGAVEALSLHGVEVPPEAVREGLRKTRWPGRLEVVQRKPLTILDCAKDPKAMENLAAVLREDFSYDRLIAVVSISRDKDIPRIIRALASVASHFIITRHGVMGRAAEPEAIAVEVERFSKPYEIVEDVRSAVRRALEIAGGDDLILVTGSVFTVGEARCLWFKPPN